MNRYPVLSWVFMCYIIFLFDPIFLVYQVCRQMSYFILFFLFCHVFLFHRQMVPTYPVLSKIYLFYHIFLDILFYPIFFGFILFSCLIVKFILCFSVLSYAILLYHVFLGHIHMVSTKIRVYLMISVLSLCPVSSSYGINRKPTLSYVFSFYHVISLFYHIFLSHPRIMYQQIF